jgi:AcrR family transcriptional regulator
MNESDRRVIRTRHALLHAFVDLTLEHGFDAVTIRQITKLADVSYSTFFRHFKNKDDLTTYVFNWALERVYEYIDNGMTPKEEALMIFKFISCNRAVYQFCSAVPRDHPAVASLLNDLAQGIESRFVAVNESEVPIAAIANHTSAAIMEVFRWWLANESKYSAEQMATIYYELIIKVKLSKAVYINPPLA